MVITRTTLTLVIGSVLLGTALTGCASPNRHCHRACEKCVVEAPTARPTSVLLFDPRPAGYPATAFAWRGGWPSTDSYYSAGQVVSFVEHFVDIQGRGFQNQDYVYRRFDTYRSGVGFK